MDTRLKTPELSPEETGPGSTQILLGKWQNYAWNLKLRMAELDRRHEQAEQAKLTKLAAQVQSLEEKNSKLTSERDDALARLNAAESRLDQERTDANSQLASQRTKIGELERRCETITDKNSSSVLDAGAVDGVQSRHLVDALVEKFRREPWKV